MADYSVIVKSKQFLNLTNVRLVGTSYNIDKIYFTIDAYLPDYAWYLTYRTYKGTGTVVTCPVTSSSETDKTVIVSWTPDSKALAEIGELELQLFALNSDSSVKYSSMVGRILIKEAIPTDLATPDGSDVFTEWMAKYEALYEEWESQKGKPNGIATLDGDGYLTSTQYNPEFNEVWDSYIVVGAEIYTAGWLSHTPGGEAFVPVTDHLYVVKTEGIYHGRLYHWDEEAQLYDLSGTNLVLGITHDNAYYGDLGKIAYDHTFMTENPHHVTKTQVGLSEADNTADKDKNVLTATRFFTPRTIGLTEGAEGTPTAFDGSADILIPVTSMDASKVHGDMVLDTLSVTGTLTTDSIVNTKVTGTHIGSFAVPYENIYAGTVTVDTDVISPLAEISVVMSDSITVTGTVTANEFKGKLSGDADSAKMVDHTLTATTDETAMGVKTFNGLADVSIYTPDQGVNAGDNVTFGIATSDFDGNLIGGVVGDLLYQSATSVTSELNLPTDVATNGRYALMPDADGPKWVGLATQEEVVEIATECFA